MIQTTTLTFVKQGALALALVLAAVVSNPARAVDGIVLIDQNKALAGNTTPGDAAGFPVTITQPGSYRLSSNLVVPNASTSAIEITASHVSLDLNGFAILGSVNCEVAFPCVGGQAAGGGNGVSTLGEPSNITVRNGTIAGMGSRGVWLRGQSNRVEDVNVRSNGYDGVSAFLLSMLRRVHAVRNGNNGIDVFHGTVQDSSASNNRFNGISIYRGTASNNLVSSNGAYGLEIVFGNYFQNWSGDNSVGTVNGGINQGQNWCNGTPCPGAQF